MLRMTIDSGSRVAALAILGLAVGSFLNVCIHRLPRNKSIVQPPSSCPHCGYVLRWIDNIPVVSYAMLGGRCRQCKAPISIRYPIVEIVTMAIFVLHYLVFGLDIILVPRLLFACALIVLFAIDLEHHLLPNVITLPGIVVGLAFSAMLPAGPRRRPDRRPGRGRHPVAHRRGLLPLFRPGRAWAAATSRCWR